MQMFCPAVVPLAQLGACCDGGKHRLSQVGLCSGIAEAEGLQAVGSLWQLQAPGENPTVSYSQNDKARKSAFSIHTISFSTTQFHSESRLNASSVFKVIIKLKHFRK